jgi:hypothetical protein
MNKIYRLLGLIVDHQILLEVTQDKFVQCLKSHVGTDMGSSLDIFSSGNTHYKGAVGIGGFYLRRKRGFIGGYNRHYCKAIGTFSEANNKLIINVEFNNVSFPNIILIALLSLMNLFAFFGIIAGLFKLDFQMVLDSFLNVLTMLLFTAIIAFVLQMVSKMNIEKMRREMESNFSGYIYEK